MGIRKIKTAVLLILIQGAAGPGLAQNPGLGQAPDPFGEGLESDDTLPRFRVEVLAFAHSAFDPNEEIFPDEHDLILLDTRPPEILVSLPTDPEYPATPKSHLEMGPPEEYKLRPTFAEQLLASLLPLEDPPDEPDTELLGPYPLDPDFVGPPEPFNPALSAGPLRPFGPDVAAPADPFGANPFGADPFGSPLTEVFPDRDPERLAAPTGPITEDGAIDASAATANETDEQVESAESIEASMQLAEETEEVEPPPAFRFLRADELQLQDTFRSLTRAGDYTPLAHGGWVQIAYPPEAEVGAVYDGKVVNITKFGAFVNILPGRDGLLHISRLDGSTRVERVEDYLSDGDELKVRVREIDRGKVSLELVEALEGATLPSSEAPSGGGGGGDRGRGRDGGRGRRDDRGGGRDGGNRGSREGGNRSENAEPETQPAGRRRAARSFDETFENTDNS